MEHKKKKKFQINNNNYNGLAENYSQFYISDKIAQNRFISKIQLNYQYFNIAICKNGGCIAICKKNNYFDFKKQSSINKNLIVMFQNGETVYKIENDELFNQQKKRYVVSLEFNYKEQLYAFCNDGEIFKIDILKEEAKILEITHRKLTAEKVLKVKAFEKGFIILTEMGTIFHLKDIKNDENSIEFMVSLRDNLNIENYIESDFLIIPGNENDENSDLKLLITRPNGDGVFLIKKPEISGTGFVAESKTQNYSTMKVDAYYINSSKVEKFSTKKMQSNSEDLETLYNENLQIGQVSGMAISDSKEKIALYVAKKKTVYLFSSDIDVKKGINFEKLVFKIENDIDDEEEIIEKNNILNFLNKQLLFLSDDCVAICGGRWVIMVNRKKETFVEDLGVDKKSDDTPKNPHIYCIGLSEVDGIRLMTESEIILIRKMPENVKNFFNIFVTKTIHPSKLLFSSYEKYITNDPFSIDELRDIRDKLSDSIFNLVKAAAFLYWIGEDEDTIDKKTLQIDLLKAANYGKSIFGKAEFNFTKFNNMCMNIRIINALRNCEEKPRFLTLDEYESLISDPSDNILKKTMRQLNFKLAFEIAKFLGLPEKDVYMKYAITKIRKMNIETSEEANEVYNDLMPMLKKLENISYIDLAKKCFKYGKIQLGHKFMNNETSSLVKIPQYLDLRDWDNSINLAIQSNDINAMIVVLDTIYKVEAELLDNKKDVNLVFVKTLSKYPTIKTPVINYLKNNNKTEDLIKYLELIKDNDELFYLLIEKFFKSSTKKEREEMFIKLKSVKPEKLDKKFYENYISDLEASFNFKKECLEKGIIDKNDTSNIDNSIFDCFEKAIPTELSWVEKENKNHFKLPTNKLTILRFKQLFKKKDIKEIENIIETGIKKLDISYIKIASMFFENNYKDKAREYALKENRENLYEEKINLLLKLEEHEEAAKVAIKIKDIDKFEELVNTILNKVRNDVGKQKAIQEIINTRK